MLKDRARERVRHGLVDGGKERMKNIEMERKKTADDREGRNKYINGERKVETKTGERKKYIAN
jgi:hypothetical protein